MRRLLALLGVFAPYLIAILIGCFITFIWFRSAFLTPVNRDAAPVSFIVEKGWNPRDVAHKLEEKQLIKHWWSVYLINNLRNRTGASQSSVFAAGEYSLSASMKPTEILDALVNGKMITHNLIVPPGSTVAQLPELMERTTLVSALEADSALNDRTLMASLEIRDSFEGYILPETYKFSRPITAQDMITRMVNEGKNRRTKEMYDRAIDLSLTFPQILTLASIIEKETGNPDERAVISSVFHNRLRIGMPLQADPTVIYGLPNFSGNLTKEHLNTPSPYNTYLNTGLPPTPICNPSMESIKAALYPEETDFLYFVATGDGSHVFSSTYKEHKANVDRYQKALKGK